MARLLIAGCLLLPLVGCAARSHQVTHSASVDAAPSTAAAEAAPLTAAAEEDYESAVATALAFELPEAKYGPPLELARRGRQASAFLGFDESVVDFYAVRTDDRQRENVKYDRYERRAVSVRSGVRYR
jgi:hypothetical protein